MSYFSAGDSALETRRPRLPNKHGSVGGTKALEIIQRNERGRQGKQRALLLKELREEEKKRRIYDATDQLEMDPEIAAANIQVRRSKTHRRLLYISSLSCLCRFRAASRETGLL